MSQLLGERIRPLHHPLPGDNHVPVREDTFWQVLHYHGKLKQSQIFSPS